MPNQWTGPRPIEDRFWEKVDKTDDGGCWLWTAYTMPNGYGLFGVRRGKMILAHRFAYQVRVGEIPSGLVIDHLCRVRNCVNPTHLEAVTQWENVLRGAGGPNGRKTHCPNGHEYTEENVYRRPGYPGSRYCRQCRRERSRSSWKRPPIG